MNIKDAAKLLGHSAGHVRTMIKRGDLDATKKNGAYEISQEMIDAHLAHRAEVERMTITWVAKEIGYCRTHLWRLVSSGAIEGKMIDGRWFISRTEVERVKRELRGGV